MNTTLTAPEAESFMIPIGGLFPKFEKHLKTKGNSRILFSGKFGIGKTYFLNEFFKSKITEYEVFHLFPINYQISSNEDITDFLKYDILIELLKKDENAFGDDDYSSLVDFSNMLYLWGEKNFAEILKTTASWIPKVGKPLKDTIVLIEKFLKFQEKVKKGKKGFIDKFLTEIKKKDVSETDILSGLLNEKIKKIKGEKESVLVLDDLERIDPEHIFRILNIFSAHLNTKNEEAPNKFGFDKIIIVADFKNLRSIFHHRYGEETDYCGYFNKYYSFEIFQFKNEEIIRETVDEIISKFIVEDPKLKDAMSVRNHGFMALILKDILLKSLNLSGKEKLDLRQLLKGIKFPITAFRENSYRKDFFEERNGSILKFINLGIEGLISIFGGLHTDFLTVLKKIRLKIKPIGIQEDHIYSFFSLSLLREMTPHKIEVGPYTWEDYFIDVDEKEDKITQIRDKNREYAESAERLFFDLLIKYTEDKFY
ncbi:MAG: P-loop NTPase fold protein [Candidatus Gracilibacteria bacterium]|nr:P-loop NTPase fold protein [Candidatus Gracilibacteria bacterium]MDD5179280.1 P-loop NTPase fold protein [Candidatus Gracilibacteria bacterium]